MPLFTTRCHTQVNQLPLVPWISTSVQLSQYDYVYRLFFHRVWRQSHQSPLPQMLYAVCRHHMHRAVPSDDKQAAAISFLCQSFQWKVSRAACRVLFHAYTLFCTCCDCRVSVVPQKKQTVLLLYSDDAYGRPGAAALGERLEVTFHFYPFTAA